MTTAAQAQIDRIAAIPEQRDRIQEYKNLLLSIMSHYNFQDVEYFVQHILADRTPVVVSRQVLQEFVQVIFNSNLPVHQVQTIAAFALRAIHSRISSFEEAFSTISENYAELLEAQEKWKEAADVLREIPLSSGLRNLTDDYKTTKYIKIAQLYLECDDAVEAEAYVNRASSILHKCTNSMLKFSHQACRARILDSQRRFLDAARHYYELSHLDKSTVMEIEGAGFNEADLDQQNIAALQKAIVCGILAPAGPQRSRLLALLCKDERSPSLPLWPILEKIFMERILKREEVMKFSESLEEHQRAMTGGGLTVVERAFIEHNMLAAAKLYNNISFQQLGSLLNIHPNEAEKIAATMICEDRMEATIDQVDLIIHFHNNKEEKAAIWQDSIEGVCTGINTIVALVARRYPQYVPDA